MKFFWKLKMELQSCHASTAMIILGLTLMIVCFHLCYSLTSTYLNMVKYFITSFNNNSFSVVVANDETISFNNDFYNDTNIKSYYTQSYFMSADKSLFLGVYSKSAFDLGLNHTGEMVDTNKDFGSSLPAMITKDLATKYKIGETYVVDGVSYYISGQLTDDILFHMSSSFSGDSFFMIYDEKNMLSQVYEEKIYSLAFVTTQNLSKPELKNYAKSISKNLGVNAVVFNWRETISSEFNKVSGMLIIGFWVLIISTIGFIANNILTFYKSQKRYTSLMYLGASRWELVRYIAVRMGIGVMISLPLSFLVSLIIKNITGITILSSFGFVLSVSVIFVIAFISLLSISKKLKTISKLILGTSECI